MLRLVSAVDHVIERVEGFGYRACEVLLIQFPRRSKVSDALGCSARATFPDFCGWLAVVLEANTNRQGDYVSLDGGLTKLWVHCSPQSSIEREDEACTRQSFVHAPNA